jgi:hypothetical protein
METPCSFNFNLRSNSVYKNSEPEFGIFMRLIALLVAAALSVSHADAQERQWRLDASAQDAFLVFGVPDTDDAGFSFWCKIGSGTISLFAPFDRNLIRHDQTIPVAIRTGDKNFNIKMKATVDKNSKTGSIEGPVGVTGTVMKAVSTATSISLTALGHKASYPLIDADISGLLRICSGEVLN